MYVTSFRGRDSTPSVSTTSCSFGPPSSSCSFTDRVTVARPSCFPSCTLGARPGSDPTTIGPSLFRLDELVLLLTTGTTPSRLDLHKEGLNFRCGRNEGFQVQTSPHGTSAPGGVKHYGVRNRPDEVVTTETDVSGTLPTERGKVDGMTPSVV